MGFGALLCSFIISSAKIFAAVVLVANALDLLPKSVTFTAFEVTPPAPLTGKLAKNTLFNNAQILFAREIKGPESFAILNGELYTTLHGGFVAKISSDHMIPIKRFGKPCNYWWEEEICGRPLGLATTVNGYLIIADSYYGIFKLNPRTGASVNLVEKNVKIKNVVPRIFNDVAAAKDGKIYWTHSSSDFHLYDGIYTMLADPSGRLVKYDPITKENEVLLDKLAFANGVVLSPEEDFVLVCESGKSRITRYYLKGPKKSQSDIFIDGLPGLPDGIRPNGKGGFLVSLNVPRDAEHAVLSDQISRWPFVRRTMARFLAFSDWSISQIYKWYPDKFLLRLGYIIGHFEMITPFFSNRTTVVELLGNGQVNDSFHSLDGLIKGISDVIAYKGYLYFGSPYNEYLARIELSKLEGKFVETLERLK